jgi:DNA-binding response OmpR family regulator
VAEQITVLLVDDERPLVGVITSHLEAEGFTVLSAFDGATALQAVHDGRPDVVVMDTDLPDVDPTEICRQVREETDAYLIVLTARDEEVDKVSALNAGADDYVLKPFSARELIARIGAMLRRPRAPRAGADRPLALADLRIDVASRTVLKAGRVLALTRTEYGLLVALASRPDRVLTRRQLLDEVWGVDWFGDEQVVDVHLGHVRRKLGDSASHPRYIRTARGVGYAAAVTRHAG